MQSPISWQKLNYGDMNIPCITVALFCKSTNKEKHIRTFPRLNISVRSDKKKSTMMALNGAAGFYG